MKNEHEDFVQITETQYNIFTFFSIANELIFATTFSLKCIICVCMMYIIDGFESNSLSSLHVCVKNLTYHSSCYFDAILSTGTQHYFQYNKRSFDSSRLSRLSLAILNFYSLISIKIASPKARR